MPPRRPFTHHLAPTGASATAEIVEESPPTAAPGDAAEQGGDGDPDGDSASPAAADPAAEPPTDGGSAEVPDGDTAEALAAPSETKNTLGEEIFGSPVGKNDVNSDDNDDAEPVRKAPVRPAPLKRRASSRVKGEPAPEPAR